MARIFSTSCLPRAAAASVCISPLVIAVNGFSVVDRNRGGLVEVYDAEVAVAGKERAAPRQVRRRQEAREHCFQVRPVEQ